MNLGSFFQNTPQLAPLLVILTLWTLPWKGVALWRAAQNKQLKWFVAMLVINTAAILEIIYIFGFSKKKEKQHHHHE
ncbi:MAG: hypothetical protein COU08_01155 [Candidatus Harrisonbacteria bacterium CG10_big_fil_rev_8_21_14_0_10_42_17]|uniref:DUF5652 domain-containing protein n=1 Tax=Candidatus Harrisonbacteria bacterium CG10_big_fil_rev_8_21_14_0_10_42_17 TaxID=1974584 RepID=A0A2M6WIJ1_9BACT|nr:MAG: hypothetical protein COU08_01155 [Candidatus Harrisonbacteria bacterium CG10_big_fil_rev_8_21_14_0_10_42_17]